MSALGRKYQHPGKRHPHAPIRTKDVDAATKILVIVIVLSLVGCGVGLWTSGAILGLAAGIGEALP